jgi:cell wall-associated NlpC family hydrolase
MADDAPAFALVIAGGVFIYAAVNHKRVIDVLLMRPSTLPAQTSDPVGTSTVGDTNTCTTPAGEYGAAIVEVAKEACAQPQGTYEYDQIRPYPSSLFSGPTPRKTDCSGFVILCYKTAGAPDPNGTNYNGQGYTGSLLARGKAVSAPSPGDLCFWTAPDHVAIYLGNGEIAEFGSNPGPITTTVTAEDGAHLAFDGYRTYKK